MPKRRPIVVSSSDDDDGEFRTLSSGRRRGRPSSSASESKKRPKSFSSSKTSASRRQSHHSDSARFDVLSEDFSECLHEFSAKPGFACMGRKELWTEKYKPQCITELAVNKKKVEEVKKWIEERLNAPKEGLSNSTLLITGPAGVGKSTTIHVIASELVAQVCEWMTPTPTLWQEHIHNSNSGIQYLSKFDEFENFAEKIQKYSLLCSTSTGESRKPIIIVIDDIPVTNGRVAFTRLSRCLASLTHLAQVPTVISITEYHKTDLSDNAMQHWEELASAIEDAGAYRVSFNPITANSIKKTLTKISQEEKFDVPAQWIDQIAKVSGGDIRHAITSLQYFTLRREDSSRMTAECSAGYNLSNSSFGVENLQISMPWGRDETVTLFHALGKFLHNKRVASSSSQDSFALKARFMRDSLKSDDPEKVLSQAHGQPRSIADFLHENVLDFIGDDAIEDASIVTSYLSDADHLLSDFMHLSFYKNASDTYEASNIPQSIAASVAVRGVSFGNSHPAPSRWHTIRKPRLWQIEQSSRHNKIQMLMERFQHHSYSSCSISCVSTEYKPATKWLMLPASANDSRQSVLNKPYPKEVKVDNMDTNSVEELNNEEIEDDIEDW